MSLPSVMKHRGIEIVVVIQEEERFLKIDDFWSVLEEGDASAFTHKEILEIWADVLVDQHSRSESQSRENQLIRLLPLTSSTLTGGRPHRNFRARKQCEADALDDRGFPFCSKCPRAYKLTISPGK